MDGVKNENKISGGKSSRKTKTYDICMEDIFQETEQENKNSRSVNKTESTSSLNVPSNSPEKHDSEISRNGSFGSQGQNASTKDSKASFPAFDVSNLKCESS